MVQVLRLRPVPLPLVPAALLGVPVSPGQALRQRLNQRATAAYRLLRDDASLDPYLILSYVVWPGPLEQEGRGRR